MKTNKLENHIKKTLRARSIVPASSAWERLSVQLDTQVKSKKKGVFFYIGVAASILTLVSVAIQLSFNNEASIPINNDVVIQQMNTDVLKNEIEKIKNEVPSKEAISTLVIKDESKSFISKTENKKNNSVLKEVPILQVLDIRTPIKKETKTIVAQNERESKVVSDTALSFPKIDLMPSSNSVIHVDSGDLLYAVTHSQEEVLSYYNKKRLSRESILEIINNELEKSNLKVDPKTILAEVERTIHDTYLENNFLKSIQERISTLATAIASRND